MFNQRKNKALTGMYSLDNVRIYSEKKTKKGEWGFFSTILLFVANGGKTLKFLLGVFCSRDVFEENNIQKERRQYNKLRWNTSGEK